MKRSVRQVLGVGLGALTLATAGAGAAFAVTTQTWRVSGQDGFLAADLESLAVSSDGVLTLAPSLQPAEGLAEGFVWCLAPSGDGVRAGTGKSGAIYRVDARGARRVASTVALDVESLLPGPGGVLYAGTSPDATIFTIGSDSTAKVLADLPARHVWGMVALPGGDLVAATGDPAVLYRVARDGTLKKLYEASAGHFVSLAFSKGTILAGTDSGGLIYAVTPEGKARVLLDAGEDEVRSLVTAEDGTIYAAVNPAGGGGEPGGDGKDEPGKPAAPRPVVYRVSSDGVAEPIWTSPDPVVQCLLLSSDGALYAGTGGTRSGGLFRINPADGRWALMGRPGAAQILSLAEAGGMLWVGTGGPGQVLSGGIAGSPIGKARSDVFDAGQVAAWGVLRWDRLEGDGGTVRLRTRTGNTGDPDETWSDWSADLTRPEGSPIASPPARFIQWEAVLERSGGGAPGLREVSAAYLAANRAPVVRSLVVTPMGAPMLRGGDGSGPQPVVQNLPGNVHVEFSVQAQRSRGPADDDEAEWARRYRVVRWEASDPNSEDLVYRLEYRSRGESDWHTIEDKYGETVYAWDTQQVPDGHYRLRVTASDSPENPPGEALEAFRETDDLVVDNTPPAVEQLTAALSGSTLHVTARLSDLTSPLKSAELTVDGETWQPVHAADRVFDEMSEEVDLSFTVEKPLESGHVIQLRAADEAGNVGVGRAPVTR